MNSPVDWDFGAQYSWVWSILMAELAVGIILNASILAFLNAFKELREIHMSLLIRYLAAQDLLYDVVCMISCALNLTDLTYVGGQTHCNWQTFYISFYTFGSGMTMTVIAYESYNNIINSRWLSNKQIHKAHIVTFCFSFILSIFVSIAPKHGHLNVTGVYCLPKFNDPVVWLVFAGVGIFTFQTIVAVIYIRIYRTLKTMQKKLDARGIVNSPRKRQVYIARVMSWYLITYLTTFSGFLVASFVEVLQGKRSQDPIMFHYAAFASHFNPFLDPLIFFVFYREARQLFLKRARICRCWAVKSTDSAQSTEYHPETMEELIGTGTELDELFHKQLVWEYSDENYDFINQVYQRRKIIEKHGVNSEECWEKTINIFEIFLAIPHAPLQVNISYAARTELDEKLAKWTKHRQQKNAELEANFKQEIEQMFDRARSEIASILHDPFIRFCHNINFTLDVV